MTKIVEYTNAKIDFKEVANKIHNDEELKVLKLCDVALDGGEDELFLFSRAIRAHPSLEELDFTNVESTGSFSIDQAICMALVTVPGLKKIRLDNVPNISHSTLETLGYATALKELYLLNDGFTDEDSATIALVVAQNHSIEHVDLTGNKMTDGGCAAFSKAIDKNLSIKVLKLDSTGEHTNKIQCKLEGRSAKAA